MNHRPACATSSSCSFKDWISRSRSYKLSTLVFKCIRFYKIHVTVVSLATTQTASVLINHIAKVFGFILAFILFNFSFTAGTFVREIFKNLQAIINISLYKAATTVIKIKTFEYFYGYTAPDK